MYDTKYIELSLNRFTSDECVPPSVEVYWGWITFEGVETVLSKEKFVPMNFSINYHELMVWFPSPDLSTYYCYWMDRDTIVISNVWTVEVVGVSRMKKLSARKWRKEKRKSASVRNNMPVGLSIGKTHLTVETIWSEWSLCSKCGKDVGKRFKTGVCSVTRADDAENLEALSIHKLPVSCSLLIDFHPEILTEADVLRDFGNLKAMNEVLGRPHRIVVGYCRGQRVCDLKLGLKIIELYKNFEMMGDGEEISGDKVEIKWWSVRYLFWLVEGLFRGVPIGWRYTPDKILFIGLVGIQLYIIILVVRRRKQAK